MKLTKAERDLFRPWINRLSLRHNLGTMLGRERVFSPSDMDTLRHLIATNRPGRPPVMKSS